ncbi:MAG: bifunctional diaminohydroxyphosphoribosylaminopyrimidine deaminase/5-amino-6-(5-phosphoribosylamino)uracil reductase RibD [Phycisphaerales bacterium]|nr:bifunctional diaminohydroxyphosphoribosylaminopyrimidine deaminase/5-amino-6-(5-phosphoribosylamino)uracil reductase RibD [Phycisphaerales bacterium]
MPRWTDRDRQYMQQALDLAIRGQGHVEPNPMVGCVIVKGHQIVGKGHHRKYGGAHAEVLALRRAGSNAKGATAYVTLEPCHHVGKTPPCVEALIDTGVRRVVVGMRDPNPLVAGHGLRALRSAGLRVETGLLRDKAAALTAPFMTYHLKRRPYVILKWAQSIDGKIATRTGDSKWITSLQSRKAGHALRARVDAVVVGVGTVLSDDPDLTARLVKPRRTASRVILDTRLRTPVNARIVKTARKTPTIIITASSGRGADRKRRSLERVGCEVITVRLNEGGIDLDKAMAELHARQMTNILVEGGGKVLGAFVRCGLADEARIFVAGKLIGGEHAPGPLRHHGPALMQDVIGVRVMGVLACGPDLCYIVGFGRND